MCSDRATEGIGSSLDNCWPHKPVARDEFAQALGRSGAQGGVPRYDYAPAIACIRSRLARSSASAEQQNFLLLCRLMGAR